MKQTLQPPNTRVVTVRARRFFEVVILIVGLQHEDASVQLGAMGLMFATHSLAFMVAGSYGQAAATRTSNELGAR